MTLEARLSELVATRGADVLGDPGEFRAALDDYLTDDEIEPGDRNVLTDAVRLGALRRLLELLGQGSDPRAAIIEAGSALARERGSDDAHRSLRATALLGYAAGRIDEQVLGSFATGSAPIVGQRALDPAPVPTAPRTAAEGLPPTRIAQFDVPAPHNKRRWVWLCGTLVLLVLAGAAVWWVVLRGGSPEETVKEWFGARSCEDEAELVTGAAADFLFEKMDAGPDDDYCATYADYRSDFEIDNVSVEGSSATVTAHGTQRYIGDDDSKKGPPRDFSTSFRLRLIDGEWLISNADTTYEE